MVGAVRLHERGRSLHIKVLDGVVKFDDLESEEQKLVEAFASRQSAKRLDCLLAQKQQIYRGVGAEVARQCWTACQTVPDADFMS